MIVADLSRTGKNPIVLTKEEIIECYVTGARRKGEQYLISWNAEKRSGTSLDTDAEGACAENAVCVYLGIPFIATVNTYKAADIAPNIQVRSTTYLTGKLIFRPRRKDKDDEIFVLVRGIRGTYEVVGWLFGYEIRKLDDCWENPGNRGWAFFIPANRLHSMEGIPYDYEANQTP